MAPVCTRHKVMAIQPEIVIMLKHNQAHLSTSGKLFDIFSMFYFTSVTLLNDSCPRLPFRIENRPLVLVCKDDADLLLVREDT